MNDECMNIRKSISILLISARLPSRTLQDFWCSTVFFLVFA